MPLSVLHGNDPVLKVNDPVLIQMGNRTLGSTETTVRLLFAISVIAMVGNCSVNPHLGSYLVICLHILSKTFCDFPHQVISHEPQEEGKACKTNDAKDDPRKKIDRDDCICEQHPPCFNKCCCFILSCKVFEDLCLWT